jgi:hypothetical protein
LDDLKMTYTERYIEEGAAAVAYTEAFQGLVYDSLRRNLEGFIIDDPNEDARLAQNLTRAARRWESALEALGCPLPPGLEAHAAGRCGPQR